MIKVLINILFTGVSASLYFTHFLSYLLAESQSHELYTNTDLLMRFNVLLLKMFSSWVEMSTAVEPEPPSFSNFCRQTNYLRFFQNNSLVIANYCDSSVLNKSISCLSLRLRGKWNDFSISTQEAFCNWHVTSLIYDWCTCEGQSSNKSRLYFLRRWNATRGRANVADVVTSTVGIRWLHSVVNHDFFSGPVNREVATEVDRDVVLEMKDLFITFFSINTKW